jgi:hypothetical protein
MARLEHKAAYSIWAVALEDGRCQHVEYIVPAQLDDGRDCRSIVHALIEGRIRKATLFTLLEIAILIPISSQAKCCCMGSVTCRCAYVWRKILDGYSCVANARYVQCYACIVHLDCMKTRTKVDMAP